MYPENKNELSDYLEFLFVTGQLPESRDAEAEKQREKKSD